MKYQVGDRVFKLNLVALFFNKYHAETFISSCIETVRFANDERFSTIQEDLSSRAGNVQMFINFQKDGIPLDHSERIVLHLEKDHDRILTAIESEHQKAIIENEKWEQHAIKTLKKDIADLQAALAILERDGVKSERNRIELMNKMALKTVGEK